MGSRDEDIFRKHVEDIFGLQDETQFDPLKEVPNLSQVKSREHLLDLNHKLVRFDGQICDMYEEEYF